VEVHNVDVGVAVAERVAEVGVVLGDEVPHAEAAVDVADDPHHPRLPGPGGGVGALDLVLPEAPLVLHVLADEVGMDEVEQLGPVGPRLVLDLVEDVVEGRELGHQLAHERFLARDEAVVVEGLHALLGQPGRPVHVVVGMQGRELPAAAVIGAEQRDLGHYSPLRGVGDDRLEAREVRGVPPVEVESVPAEPITRRLAAGPGDEGSTRGGGERVEADPEIALLLEVGPGEEADEVQAGGRHRVEVAAVVEVGVQDGAVVLGRPHEQGRPPAEDREAGVFGMGPEGLGPARRRGAGRGEHAQGDRDRPGLTTEPTGRHGT